MREIPQAGHVTIIAEAGVNHDGDLNKACDLIDAARAACADFVKFQCFSADALAAPDAPTCTYQARQNASSQHDMLKRLELGRDDFAALKAHADRAGIGFLATPFGLCELTTLVELGVPAIKIASPDIVNTPLLDSAAQTRLPLIVSTGAADLAEVDAAVSRIRRQDARYPIALLHCVSSYPTPLSDARLGCIRTLRDRFQVPVGFSDHTVEAETGALAVAAGAVILEKHLTLDRSGGGPDHFFSLTPSDFATYVEGARAALASLGNGVIGPAPIEREVRQLARGSIVAARALSAGSVLSPDMLIVQRPGTGLSPTAWDDVLGRTLERDLQQYEPLSHDALR